MLGEHQWDLIDWLNQQSGPDVPQLPPWRRALHDASAAKRGSAPHKYRDLPFEDSLLAQANGEGKSGAVHKKAQEAERTAFGLHGEP